ncbi:hypothetical protein Pfo_005423, partial [Paulownia fortunei]
MSATNPPKSVSSVSLGYGIAVAVSVLVLISTVVLASYICVRVKASSGGGGGGGGRRREEESNDHSTRPNNQSQEPTKIVLGLDKPIIETYPTIELGQSRRLPKPNNTPCSICLSDYCVKDKLRCIPECNHCFHARCIDEWLKVN